MQKRKQLTKTNVDYHSIWSEVTKIVCIVQNDYNCEIARLSFKIKFVRSLIIYDVIYDMIYDVICDNYDMI